MSQKETADDLIAADIKQLIHEKLAIEADKLQDDVHFQNDLGVDSLDLIELQVAVEKHFSISIPDETGEGLNTVGKLIAFVREKKPNSFR